MWRPLEAGGTSFVVMSKVSSSLWKLALMTLTILAVAMVLMWLLVSWALDRSFDDVGRAIILDDLGEYGVLLKRNGAEEVRALFTAGEHEKDQLLRIVDADGQIILDVDVPEQPWARWPDLPPLTESVSHEVHWHRHRLGNGMTLMIGRQKFADGKEIWFGRTNAADLVAIDRVHDLILVAIGITAVLAIGPVFWFSSRVLRPVRLLIAGARRLADEDDLGHRLETSQSIPEVGEFADAFNEILDRVQSLTEELEAANDQLAHELRTPLARIRGNVERILTRSERADSREDAARSIGEIDRATNLIQAILSIRAGDARSMKLQLEEITLSNLVRETCELYSASAEERDLRFDLLITGEEQPLQLDRQRFQQALCNLLDNALAYTPTGGRVEVEIDFEDDSVVARVRDSGPGLQGDDSTRIWRRFMRGTAASADTPGIGLGLSLVGSVVHAHRGEAGAQNLTGGGAEFWMRFPLNRLQKMGRESER